MSRASAFVVTVGVLAAAVGLAFWALQGDEQGGTGDGDRPAARTVEVAEGDDAAGGDATKRGPRARQPGEAAAPDEDPETVLSGVVVDEKGAPVAGAAVDCFRVAGDAANATVARLRERFGGLLDDSDIDLLARQLGAPTDEAPEEQMQRAMSSGRRLGSRLAANPSALSRAGRIARDVAAGLEFDADLERLASATTGADGSFAFAGLPAGSVELRVTAPRFQRRKERAKVGATDVRIELAAAGIVAGQVLCDGNPVAGAEVRFRTRSVRTGPDGRFRHDGARPPREPVIVTAPGCVARGRWATVTPGEEPEPLVIELDAAGRVSGRVTTRAGVPVSGAEITFPADAGAMFRMMMPALGGDAVPVPPPSARTGDDGTYVLEGVPARAIKLQAERDGYLPARPAEVRVTANGVVEHVDFVLVLGATLEGRVTDDQGRPLAGAEVRVKVPGEGMMRMAAQWLGGLERASRTGADGSYRVTGLPDGDRDVSAEADGRLTAKETVHLDAEATVRRDFALRPGLRIAGHVIGPDGAPVPGATVRATGRATGPSLPFLPAGGDARTAVTDESGAFAVTGLQEGPHRIAAAAPRFLEGVVEGVDPGAEDVVVRLGAAATIRGVVVASETDRPVQGAHVLRRDPSVRRNPNPMMAFLQRDVSVDTAPDGTFEMTGLTPGTWEVWTRADGYAESAHVNVTVAAGAAADGISLALPPGSELSGRVLRKADGSAVQGAVLWVRTDSSAIQPPNPAEILGDVPSPPDGAASATSSEDGTFAIGGLTPGKVTLEVRAAGFAPQTVAGAETPGASLVVELSAGGAVEGTVLDKDGRPFEGQQVILQQGMMGMGYLRTASTDRAGNYAIDRIPPGSYSILLLDAESPMGMGGMATVAVRDGETTRHDFSKKSAGSPVEGIVTADGKPVTSATVMLVGGTAGMQIAATEEDGTFRFDHADAGEYQVMVQTSAMGGGSNSTRVTVGADGTPSHVEIQLSTLAVEGSVVDGETGKGVPLAQVVLLAGGAGGSLQDQIARQKGQTISDAEGRFAIRGVPDGTFSVRVSANGYAETSVDNVSGGGAPVRVVLSRGIELAVTVLGPDGRPVAAANVVPEDASGKRGLAMDFSLSKVTGPEGIARLRLQPGTYVLHVGAAGFPPATATADAGAGAVTVRLEAGGAVEVTVRDGAGAPVKGASVKLLDADGAEIRDAFTIANFLGSGGTTDDSGRARREGIRPGKVTVVVRSPAGKEARAEAAVSVGGVAPVAIVVD